MKRTISLALASGLAFLVAGCAGGGAGGSSSGTTAAGSAGEAQPAVGGGGSPGATTAVRDFALQVKCPGIHLEKTKLKWNDDKIMSHQNVTPEDIASCEQFTAAQPKGYVPPPPAGATQVGNATGPQPTGGTGNNPSSPH